jgi:hypothetical protein
MAMDWQNLKNFLSHNIKQSALTRIKQLGNFSDPIPPTPRGKKKKKRRAREHQVELLKICKKNHSIA